MHLSFFRWGCVRLVVLSVLACGAAHGLAQPCSARPSKAQKTAQPLQPECFRHYIAEFRKQELKADGQIASMQSTEDPWPWMVENIPWFESSDKRFEEMYYFRWYSAQKHLETTERGRLVNEFLKPVKWAGYGQTIVDASPHHMRDLRWLRHDTAAEDYARFWSTEPQAARDYSVALASSVLAVEAVRGNRSLLSEERPFLERNYSEWERTHQDSNGLFWSIDTRDGMEVSISGDGYRPTLNSYMYGDAKALALIESLDGNTEREKEYLAKAAKLRELVLTQLWNSKDQFFEVQSPARDSGIRAEKKFKDNGTSLQMANVRELIGYAPWYFDLPSTEHVIAWKQVADKQGFAAPYGPLTAERRSPRFRYPNDDQCQWNGPTWAFATTQALTGLGNLLNGEPQQAIGRAEYYRLFETYVHGEHMQLQDGQVIPWIDEAEDGETGEWITKRVLAERHSPLVGRGSYYNHSGFADPLITGLVGIRPSVDDTLVINPLVPTGTWTYFALQDVPYHHRLLTITYDADGKRYPRGLRVYIDGKLAVSRKTLERVVLSLKAG